MFSYLRPYRRTPSNPTSPDGSHDHAHPQRYRSDQSAPISPPPTLPPINRLSTINYDGFGETWRPPSISSPREKSPRYTNNAEASKEHIRAMGEEIRAKDMHTFINHQQMGEGQRPDSAGNIGSSYTSSQPSMAHQEPTTRPRPPDTRSRPGMMTSISERPVMTGRRPTGARLPTPPPGSNSVSTFEPTQPKSKRMNLLNPMSLLARRRTSQAVAQLSAESLVSNRNGHSASPSYSGIRGTVVHDFSAPRPKRVLSTPDARINNSSNYSTSQYQRSPNPQASENGPDGGGQRSGGHTPVFTEDFEEEQYPAAGPHVRKASDISDLPLPSLPYAKGAQRSLDSKVTEDGPPKDQLQDVSNTMPTTQTMPDRPPPVPPKSSGRSGPPIPVSTEPVSSALTSRVSTKGARPRNVSEVSTKESIGFVLPKHMKSTSSRFSFDMIGAAEQERLLEDRHRQRALERKGDGAEEQGEDDRYDEDYDYENMDDGGFEEEIPMVGDDYDEMDLGAGIEEDVPLTGDVENDAILDDHINISRFTFQQPLLSPLSPNSPGTLNTPRDANGDVIGFAITKNSPYPSMDAAHEEDGSVASSVSTTEANDRPTVQDLGASLPNAISHTDTPTGTSLQRSNTQTVYQFADDDIYFDDGMIDDLGEDNKGNEFDESVFDNVDTDQYGRSLKTFSSLPTLYAPPSLAPDTSASSKGIKEDNGESLKTELPRSDNVSQGTNVPAGGLAPQASVMVKETSVPSASASDLTQDTLEAYQSALAAAAFNAAANGKFRRDSKPGPSNSEDNQPGLVADSSQASQFEPLSSYEDEDDFDYDDALEDDAIIAAANAEALAYDTDGFYGQEFGFYLAPAGQAEYSNGGYFGPRGVVESVNRTRSGRLADREANLTPITERSEYSNRNSFMFSPGFHRPESLASPGLSQLAGMMSSISSPDYHGDMSLDALLKLRRGAWGGSQASLHSSTGGSPRSAGGAENSSPVEQLPPWAHGGAVTLPMGGHRRTNSSISLVSEVETENNSPPASPTLMQSTFIMSASSKEEDVKNKEKEVKKHRHTASADSISYSKEDDPGSPTGERWVLERRRTSEGGVELLGREVVSGGRI